MSISVCTFSYKFCLMICFLNLYCRELLSGITEDDTVCYSRNITETHQGHNKVSQIKVEDRKAKYSHRYLAVSNDWMVFLSPDSINCRTAVFTIIHFYCRCRFLWTSAADLPGIARLCGWMEFHFWTLYTERRVAATFVEMQ